MPNTFTSILKSIAGNCPRQPNSAGYDRSASYDDFKQIATIVAGFVYNTAMRDEMLPRKQLETDTD